uniref:Putative secreted peptide n=1 Tax=Anopheles braziliensis TaxID=58242 RepID=A0A2M3ZSF8_9DIPT
MLVLAHACGMSMRKPFPLLRLLSLLPSRAVSREVLMKWIDVDDENRTSKTTPRYDHTKYCTNGVNE